VKPFTALIVLCCLLSGCSTDYSPQAEVFKTVKAEGILLFKGKPLPGFLVSLHPADGKRTASGLTDAEGRFSLGTNAVADGAIAGSHRVSVVWQPPEDDGLGSTVDDPRKLPKAPIQLPPKFASPETSELTVSVPESGSSELKIEIP
jgi:hypothetical protein